MTRFPAAGADALLTGTGVGHRTRGELTRHPTAPRHLLPRVLQAIRQQVVANQAFFDFHEEEEDHAEEHN